MGVAVGLDGTVVVHDRTEPALVRLGRDGSESTSDQLKHGDAELRGQGQVPMTLVGTTAVAYIPIRSSWCGLTTRRRSSFTATCRLQLLSRSSSRVWKCSGRRDRARPQ